MKQIRVKGTDWFFEDERVVSLLPRLPSEQDRRRWYLTVDYEGGKAFVKSFAERTWTDLIRNRLAPRGRKEYDLGRRLGELGIFTPKPLGYGIARTGSFIIQEHMDGQSLAAVFKEEGITAQLVTALGSLIGLLRERHIRHNDLHLNNVLVTRESRLCLIDLHKMRIKESFSKADEVSNISHALLAVYDDMDEDLKTRFFQAYGSTALRRDVEGEFKRLSERFVRRKKQRALRSTSIIVRDGLIHRFVDADGLAEGSLTRVLKEDRKIKVDRYGDHIRKTYRSRHRLIRAWKAHVVLAYMDISITPRVFLMERSGLFSGGSIAMEDLSTRGKELDRFLDDEYDSMDPRRRRAFADAFSGFLKGVLRKGILHRDMKACNLFVLTDGRFMFIDVEDIRFREATLPDLKRLLFQLNTTVPKKIGMRERIRFFKEVAPLAAPEKKAMRALLREVAEESRRSGIAYQGRSGLVEEKW